MFFGIFLLCIVGSIPANAIHRYMTLEERNMIFNTKDPNNIPKYELVEPIIDNNSPLASVNIKLKAFGENINLYLNPTEGILAGYDTPVWEIKSGRLGPILKRVKDVFKNIKFHLLEDTKTGATVVVEKKPNENLNIRGYNIGKNMAIHALPDRLKNLLSSMSNKVPRKVRSVEDIKDNSTNKNYHIVYKTSGSSVNSTFSKTQFKRSPRSKRSTMEVVSPQILVVIDNNYFKKLGNDIVKALPYLLTFWNGVDLMYRSLESPKFRLNIAGFVFAKDDNVLSYMTENTIEPNYLDVTKALHKMSVFWYHRNDIIPYKSYDVAATMTTEKLCFETTLADKCDTLGVSNTEGACQVSEDQKAVFGVTIFKDNAAFQGISTGAHELGHSFGVQHDNREHCSSGNNVHIMSTHSAIGTSSSDWSDCSLKDFSNFLSSEVSSCLHNKPNAGKALPKYLPGKTMSSDQQCQAMGYIETLKIDENICVSLECVVKYEDIPVISGSIKYVRQAHCVSIGAAAEGTTCGEKKICLHNQCIKEEKIK